MNGYLGIDIGTSGCKAVVFNDFGRQVSLAYRKYSIISPLEGCAEIDADEVIIKCFEVIKESAKKAEKIEIKGIGISSQGEAFTLLDKDGNTLINAYVSSDTRAKEITSEWSADSYKNELYEKTGHTVHPMFSLFKILWIQENLPELWQKTNKIVCFEDLLQHRLGITTPKMGYSLAARTMLFNIREEKWDDEILHQAKIDKELLSVPVESGTICGVVSKTIAKQLHLPDHTIVVAGGHDQICSALGANAIEPGSAVYTSGTVECITPIFDTFTISDELKNSNLCMYHHAVKDRYATVAFNLTGGNILQWFVDEFGSEIEHRSAEKIGDKFEMLIEGMPPDPTELLVLPYFTASGTPYFDSHARGAILGLNFRTTKGDILKALLEGVALEMKLNLNILQNSGCHVKELIAGGGGTKSQVLNQLKSDVLGIPITLLETCEAGCKGVAMLAKASYENTNVFDIASGWINKTGQINPNPAKDYSEKFEKYKQLYPALVGFFPE